MAEAVAAGQPVWLTAPLVECSEHALAQFLHIVKPLRGLLQAQGKQVAHRGAGAFASVGLI